MEFYGFYSRGKILFNKELIILSLTTSIGKFVLLVVAGTLIFFLGYYFGTKHFTFYRQDFKVFDENNRIVIKPYFDVDNPKIFPNNKETTYFPASRGVTLSSNTGWNSLIYMGVNTSDNVYFTLKEEGYKPVKVELDNIKLGSGYMHENFKIIKLEKEN